VSADGKRVAIGAVFNKGEIGRSSGHVRVYDLNEDEGKCTQVGDDIDGEAANDRSGISVAMSADGKRVAIGAVFNKDENGRSSGHVHVYDLNEDEGKWTQVGDDIDGEAANDRSGITVAMSADGTRVAIGAQYNKGENGSKSGHVRVYEVRGFLDPCVLHVFACVPKFCTNLNMSQSV
jgi:hypothetical protein